MAQTFTSNYVHIVFSTKQRQQLIKDRPKLWDYMAGIAKNIRVEPRAIGGWMIIAICWSHSRETCPFPRL